MNNQFFTAAIVLLVFAICSAARAETRAVPEANRVFVLLAMDTHANNIGNWIKNDSALLTEMFEGVAREGRLEVKTLKDDQLTRDNVVSHLKSLPATANDTIVFIYSGHGGVKKGRHFLAFKHQGMYRSEVHKLMSEKEVRLSVMFTASCAGSEGVRPLIWYRSKPANASPRKETLRDLLFRSTGVVDINSSKAGFVSWVSASGALGIHALVTMFNADLNDIDIQRADGFVEWSEATDFLTRMTNYYTGVKNDGTLDAILDDAQAAEVFPRHAPDRIYAWRIGIDVESHWSGEGVMVRSVEPNSPAGAKGLRNLDRIVSINGQQITNTWHTFSHAIRNADQHIDLIVERIVNPGNDNQNFKTIQLNKTLAIAHDTTRRHFNDSLDHKPLFDVAKYFRRVFNKEFIERLEDRDQGSQLSFTHVPPEFLHRFAWLCIESPRAMIFGQSRQIIWIPNDAIAACRQACRSTKWNNPLYIATLAAAYAESGQFDLAVKYQHVAVDRARPEDQREFERRLRLYRNGVRYREPY